MLNRVSWLQICAVVLLAASCGVQEHQIGRTPLEPTGVAGTTGAAGTGAAGTGAGGTSLTGAAGDSNATGTAGVGGGTAGVAGPTGSAGTTGGAGVTGVAGTTGAAGTGSAAGGSVVLGGVTVPKENAIAFIHLGHSNMAGRGRNPTGSRAYHFTETDPRAWMYHTPTLVPFVAGAKGGFELAAEPKTAGDRSNVRQPATPWGGPGTSLVKQAAAMAPGKYFVSVGFGQASVYCTEYLPGGLYYDRVMTAAKELKGKVTFGAIIVLLGITERHGTAADIQNYPNCINQLVTAIRKDVEEPNLPVLINGYEMCSNRGLAPTSSFAQAIIPRIAAVPTTVTNAAVVPTDNPLIPCEVEPNEPDGDHHFTLDGHKEYTRRVLQIMKDKGWWRW